MKLVGLGERTSVGSSISNAAWGQCGGVRGKPRDPEEGPVSWGRPRDKPSLLGAVAEEPGRSRWDPAERYVTPWA